MSEQVHRHPSSYMKKNTLVFLSSCLYMCTNISMLAYSCLQIIAFFKNNFNACLNKFIATASVCNWTVAPLHAVLWLIFPYPLLELCYCCPESVSLFSPLSSTCLGLLELTVKPRQLGLVTFLGRRELSESEHIRFCLGWTV